MTEYVFREGARIKGVDAQTIGDELESIRERDGKIETTAVVDAARPKEAPLHPAFEWRDNVAAEEYRREQARRLVRSVRVVIKDTGETAPAYVHVSAEERKGPGFYQTPQIVAADVDQYERAMSYALAKFRAAERAVDDLRRAAAGSSDKDRLAQINVILKTLTTAGKALAELH